MSLSQYPRLTHVMALAAVVALSSCSGGGGGGGGGPGIAPAVPASPVSFSRTVGGQVVDARTGTPLPGASVVVEDPLLATTADANGFFSFENVQRDAVVVSALFSGYVPAVRKLEGIGSSNRALSLRLQPIGIIGSFKNSVSDTFVDDNARLTLQPGTLWRDDGSPVQGEVEVELTYIAPSSLAAPGAFDDAVDLGGGAVSLESFGLVSIDLFDGGFPVELVPGAAATLEVVLPAGAQGRFAVNDVIGLWNFDEAAATWVEMDQGLVGLASDGSGNLSVVASLPHFSFWNLALMIKDLHCIVGVVESDGEPLAGAEVVALGQSFGGTRITFTDEDGAYQFQVPPGSSLRVETRPNGSANAVEGASIVVPATVVECDGAKGASGVATVVDLAVVFNGCVSGFVLDHEGFPVVDAPVALVPGETVFTEADGYFCGRSVSGSTVFVTTPGFSTVKSVAPTAGGSCAADSCTRADVFDLLPQTDDLVGTVEIIRATEAASGSRDENLTAIGTFLAGDVDVLIGLIDQNNGSVESCDVVDLYEVSGCVIRVDQCVISEEDPDPIDLSDIAPVDAGGFIEMRATNDDFADLLPGNPLDGLPLEAGIYLPELEDLEDLGFLSGPHVTLSIFGGAGIGAIADDVELPGDIKVLSPKPESLDIDRRFPLVISWTPAPGPQTLYLEVCSSVLVETDPVTFEDVCIEKEVNASLGRVVIPGAVMAELHDPAEWGIVDHFFCMFRFVEGEITVPLLRTGGEARVRVSADNELFASDSVPSGGALSLKKDVADKRAQWRDRHEEFFRTRMRRRLARSVSETQLSISN